MSPCFYLFLYYEALNNNLMEKIMRNTAKAIFVICHLFILGANAYAADSSTELTELNAHVKQKTFEYHLRDQLSKITEIPARWDGCDKSLCALSVGSAWFA
jgi:thymidylate kinase